MTDITAALKACREEGVHDFSAKSVPVVDPDRIMGVRSSEIKCLARQLCRTAEADEFLQTLPHYWLEENILHAVLLAERKNVRRISSAN